MTYDIYNICIILCQTQTDYDYTFYYFRYSYLVWGISRISDNSKTNKIIN